MSWTAERPVFGRLDVLAADVGQLRRRCNDAQRADVGLLLDRISSHVEVLDAMLRPTASDLYGRSVAVGIDDDQALADALAAVDDRTRELRKLLGGKDAARAA